MSKAIIPRDEKGRILPGYSLNPTGNPKGASGLAKMIRKRTGDGDELVTFAQRLLRGQPVQRYDNEGNPTDMLVPSMDDMKWAAQWLSDRGYGKAPMTIEINEGPKGEPEIDFSNVSDEDFAKIKELMGVSDDDIIDAEFEEVLSDGES